MRCIKSNENIYSIIAKIGTIMLQQGFIPQNFQSARTILIFKKGDQGNLNNWRPISICSLLRRIIEKILDKQIRNYIVINKNQRGFMHMAGCHINNAIIENILNICKNEKIDGTLIFLDMEKAYDSIGHDHLINSIRSSPIPTNLQNIIISLHTNNKSYIDMGINKTKSFFINKGVFQGSPLSPILFNLCINYIFDEMTELDICKEYGFKIEDAFDPLSIIGYADDIVLTAKDHFSANNMLTMIESKLLEIGLKINPSKSGAIVIKKGLLCDEPLRTNLNENIVSIQNDETIKYLGVSYSNVLMLDKTVLIKKFGDKLEILTRTNLLDSHQKLNIFNQYIAPCLLYTLQTAPLEKITTSFLNKFDNLIRSSVKEILQLPGDTPNSFLYACKSVKGLGVFNCFWETFIQQFNKFIILEKSKCAYIEQYFENKKDFCLKKLNFCDEVDLADIKVSKKPSSLIRSKLREKEFNSWCALTQKGKGVILYESVKHANGWIYNKRGLSNSEWIDCLKMTCNVSAVRAVPGRSMNNTIHCRHCNEFESLAHVLGYCGFGETARIKRHNEVRTMIANSLRSSGLEVHEEIIGISGKDSLRRIDMIAIDRIKNTAFIIDPTIRFEQNSDQPNLVHEEKRKIYEPTIPFYKSKFKVDNISVIGLLFGSRGTLTQNYIHFRKKFKLPKSLDYDIVLKILKSSVYILRHHLFGIQN